MFDQDDPMVLSALVLTGILCQTIMPLTFSRYLIWLTVSHNTLQHPDIKNAAIEMLLAGKFDWNVEFKLIRFLRKLMTLMFLI